MKCMYPGGVNLTSLLFSNIYRIYIFIVWFDFTPLLMIDKKGERNSENNLEFICMFRKFICIFRKRGRMTLRLLCMFFRNRVYTWLLTIDIIYACLLLPLVLSIYVFVYAKREKHSSLMHVCIEHSLHIFMFIALHELRGSFYEA